MTEKEYAEDIFNKLEETEKEILAALEKKALRTPDQVHFLVQVEILRQLRIQTALLSGALTVRPLG